MTTGNTTGVPSSEVLEDASEIAKYGITKVQVDYFYVGDFRYTDLEDAIAQARRQTAAD